MLERVNEITLKWFVHMDRMDYGRLNKRIYKMKFNGVRGLVGLRSRWVVVKKKFIAEGLVFRSKK